MQDTSNRQRLLRVMGLMLLLGGAAQVGLAQQGAIVPNSGFVVFGKVSLPDGKPATRVQVFLETVNGVKRDTLTDDQGSYEIRGLTGRFRFDVSALNLNEPTQYTDPVNGDPTRAYANRLQINLQLRFPLNRATTLPPGTVNAVEAAQNIPKEARKAYEQGLKAQKENQPDKALAQFDQAIDAYPNYFQALAERGSLRMARNQHAEAAADFIAALKHNEKYVPALRGLGYCQLQQKHYDAALANLENAYKLAPQVGLTLMLLGYANLSVERYEPARQCLQEALRLDAKGAARAHVYLAEILAHEQKFKEAADEIQTYLKANPQAADAVALKEMAAKWQAQSKANKSQ